MKMHPLGNSERANHPLCRVIRHYLGAIFAAIVASTTACAGGEPEIGQTVTRDSAGIEVVENVGSRGKTDEWIVSASPAITLGTPDAPDPEQFQIVLGATRLSNGRIVVAERAQRELRFFNRDGGHLLTVGGRGDGPAEFQVLGSMVRTPGDSLLVLDSRTMGYTVFGPAGEFVRTVRPNIGELRDRFESTGSVCTSPSVFVDGSILWCGAAPELGGEPELPVLRRARSKRLIRLHLDQPRVDYLGLYLGIENYSVILDGYNYVSARHPFYSSTYVALAVDPMRLYLANNPRYEIEVWDPNGALMRIIRRLDAESTATETQLEEARKLLLSQSRYASRILAEYPVPIPDLVPAVHGLTAGPHGELWVRRGPFMPSSEVTTFDVFDVDGIYMGAVSMPEDRELLEVGYDYLLTLRFDDLDVPIVELYRLVRSDG